MDIGAVEGMDLAACLPERLGDRSFHSSCERATALDARENGSRGLRREHVFISNPTTGSLGFKVIFDTGVLGAAGGV